jgi:gliding motility-associated-like protein
MKRIMIPGKKTFQAFFSFLAIFLSISIEVFAQPDAKFIVDVSQGCTPLVVHFTNQSTGTSLTYSWNFGEGDPPTTSQNPSHTFNNQGLFSVELKVTDINGLSDFAYANINVIYNPPANMSINKTPSCINEKIEFTHPTYPIAPDSVLWSFGDGETSNIYLPPTIAHYYMANGIYTVKYITYNEICSDTSENTITISGPATGFIMSQDEVCVNDTITFSITNTTDITDIRWDFGDGTTADDVETVKHSYANYGYKSPKLLATGLGRTCTIEDSIQVFHVEAGIGYSDLTLFCDERFIYFQNLSTGNDFNDWNFGDGGTSTQISPQHIYQTGDYIAELVVRNNFGCIDTLSDSITIHNLPDIQLGEGWFVCEGGSNTLIASGGDSILWYPPTFLSDPNSFEPVASPEYTINYQATVINKSTKCSSTGYILVEVQEEPVWDIAITPENDTIIIGETITLDATQNTDYNYQWSPDYQLLSASDSTSLVVQPLVSTTYSLLVSDLRDCFSKEYPVLVNVKEAYVMGLPEAFTPNNDGINDEINVSGWGIKTLFEFKIYNRWGTEVFSTNDLNTGWDGTFKDKPQPIDSYSYYIKAVMWDDKTVEKKGTFTLIR